MSALTRLVSTTIADISHKRQSKRLVHDEESAAEKMQNAPTVTTADDNPNFNTFDPSEHFGNGLWQSTSAQISPASSSSSTSEQTDRTSPTSSETTSNNSDRKTQLKNMVRKLTPFNNNNKEAKNRNIETETSEIKSKEEEKKGEKKGLWKSKETKKMTKCGDRQMLIDLDSDSF